MLTGRHSLNFHWHPENNDIMNDISVIQNCLQNVKSTKLILTKSKVTSINSNQFLLTILFMFLKNPMATETMVHEALTLWETWGVVPDPVGNIGCGSCEPSSPHTFATPDHKLIISGSESADNNDLLYNKIFLLSATVGKNYAERGKKKMKLEKKISENAVQPIFWQMSFSRTME